MSYTVLARKYRSTNFDELVGQEHIAQTLKKAIESGRIAHAYLFCGTRGTGKTSAARILAKCLNCEKTGQPTAHPCNECGSCEGIRRGDDIDVIEIDAASNTQVEKTREIIDNAQYRPARSRFKIYIIDEVHMLSKASFNALLKTLEEPPEHVKFILATTEPEKVLATILSRCQRYDFRNIPTREIAQHLKSICEKEQINADEDALLLVAKAGAGSMRDSLSLLDRLLSVGEKSLTVEMIEQLLGLPRTQLVFDLAQAIGEADVPATLGQADAMISAGLAPDTLIGSLIDHLRNLLILRTCGAESHLVEVPGMPVKELVPQAAKFDPVLLSQDIVVLEELRRQLRTSQAGRALIDAALVRLALTEQFKSIGDLLNETSDGNASAALKKKSGEVSRLTPSPLVGKGRGEGENARSSMSAPAPVKPTNLTPHPNPLPQGERGQEQEDDDDLPAVGKVWDNSGPSLSELLKQRADTASQSDAATPPDLVAPTEITAPAESPVSNIEPVGLQNLPAVWQKLLDALAARGPSFHSLISQGRLSCIEDGRAVIRFERRHETFIKRFDQNGKKDIVRDVLSEVTGESLGVRFEVEDIAPATSTGSAGASTAASVADSTTATQPLPVRPSAPAARPEPVRRAIEPPVSRAAPPPVVANTVRVTQELIDSIRSSETLIKNLMDELGATIVKIEPPEAIQS